MSNRNKKIGRGPVDNARREKGRAFAKSKAGNTRVSPRDAAMLAMKVAAIVFIVWVAARAFFIDGLAPCYSAKDYSYQNDFDKEQTWGCGGSELTQGFTASGNLVTSISLYFAESGSGSFTIDLLDARGGTVRSVTVSRDGVAAGTWKKVAFDCRVQRGQDYELKISSDRALDFLLIDGGGKPEAFGSCKVDQREAGGGLVFGIKQTYRYMTAASKLDLAFGIILLALMLSALCYSVLKMEKLVSAFSQAEKKQGILYALYFATSFTLLFNPIDPARTGVASFDRVFGAGFNANVDVSRRVKNFYFYFLCFVVSFLLVFLLANFLKSREIAGERKKMAVFLDQFMVLANVNLLLRCITFFSDSESADAVFHYSTALILANSALVSTATYKESAIADGAAARIEDFTGTWTPGRFAEEEALQDPNAPATYWREIQKKGEPAERAAWDSALENTISKYRYVIDALLEPGETFVDMTNNTFLYSAINRRDPVYVSQSPLQLSGEYSQERFVEEIKGVPIVLMPVGGIYLSDAYHVYKVAEYVSQNYVPLCKCSSSYAVWCLPERYDEMHAKCKELEEQTLETGLWESFSASAGLRGHNCELRQGGTAEAVTLASVGIDPYLAEVQSVIDTSKYEGQILRISMDYASSKEGQMQVFYTTEENESYAEKKSVSFELKRAGTATFDIPVTEFTRIRIDIPEESSVTIKSLKIGRPIEDIDFGYDEPKSAPNQEGDVLLTYPSNLHNYSIEHLPRIWADFDESTSNEECAECVRADDGTLTFDRGEILPGENGNYLLLRASYGGDDEGGDYLEDGETASAILKLGVCQEGRFVEKYQFRFTIEEGVHDYIFRVSCDYNWYHEPINSARLQSDADIDVESAKILEGD